MCGRVSYLAITVADKIYNTANQLTWWGLWAYEFNVIATISGVVTLRITETGSHIGGVQSTSTGSVTATSQTRGTAAYNDAENIEICY